MKENNSARDGLLGGLPICFGYLSCAFAFGIFAKSSGLSVLEATLISALNVTSAGQLAAVPIITGGGGFLELALTQLIINLRYALMSVSLSQKLGDSVSLRDRFIISFVNTDEVFAVAMSNSGSVGKKYLYALISTPFLGWTVGTLLGAIAGEILPEVLVSALGIAIYAMFIAIILPEMKKERSTALCVLLSVVLSLLFYYLPVLRDVPSGFVIIICAVFASALFSIVSPIPEETEADANA